MIVAIDGVILGDIDKILLVTDNDGNITKISPEDWECFNLHSRYIQKISETPSRLRGISRFYNHYQEIGGEVVYGHNEGGRR